MIEAEQRPLPISNTTSAKLLPPPSGKAEATSTKIAEQRALRARSQPIPATTRNTVGATKRSMLVRGDAESGCVPRSVSPTAARVIAHTVIRTNAPAEPVISASIVAATTVIATTATTATTTTTRACFCIAPSNNHTVVVVVALGPTLVPAPAFFIARGTVRFCTDHTRICCFFADHRLCTLIFALHVFLNKFIRAPIAAIHALLFFNTLVIRVA
jgi:hypothetical protein